MKKTKKLKQGFTLVELIVTMAIFSIILLSLLSLVGPVMNIVANVKKETISDQVTTNVQSYLENRLKYATNIQIYRYLTVTEAQTLSYPNGVAKNPDGTPAEEIKCLRLKWADRGNGNKGYTLTNIPVDSAGGIVLANEQKVFNDAYFGDIYYMVDVLFPKNSAGADVTNALTVSITPYSTSDFKKESIIRTPSNNTFSLENIALNYHPLDAPQYTVKFKKATDPGTGDELEFSAMPDDQKDIFIYYVVRKPV